MADHRYTDIGDDIKCCENSYFRDTENRKNIKFPVKFTGPVRYPASVLLCHKLFDDEPSADITAAYCFHYYYQLIWSDHHMITLLMSSKHHTPEEKTKKQKNTIKITAGYFYVKEN